MPIVMKFTGKCNTDDTTKDILVFGSTEFPNMPLFSSRVSTSRKDGIAIKKCDVTLTGFVRGVNHFSIRTLLESIRAMQSHNHLFFWYLVDNIAIVDNLVYIDSVSEPTDWKEYNAKYVIQMHYFTCPCEDDVIDRPVTAITPGGELYTFEPQPTFSITSSNIRQASHGRIETVYGDKIGVKITRAFTGILCSTNNRYLTEKMDKLKEVVRDHFVLRYGEWSDWVFVESPPSFELSDFNNHAIYKFTVSHYDSEIEQIKSKITFTRPHNFVKVTPRLYCAKTDIDEFHESGQYITYSLTLKSIDTERTREHLGKEFEMMIVGGGKHMSGGRESWNEDDSMTVTARFYYEKAVLPLVEGNWGIPDEVLGLEHKFEEPVQSVQP